MCAQVRVGSGRGGQNFRVAGSRHSEEMTPEQMWKEVRRGGEWIPQKELPGGKSRFKGAEVGMWLCVLGTELEGR